MSERERAAPGDYGDEKTLFELVAGKQYAIHGFRNWGIICALGLAVLVLRMALDR